MFANSKRQLYSSPFDENPQKILSGLGKCTKRGVKRCNCGHYNGTRSGSCKNSRCSKILKNSNPKSNSDAVKLLTNTERRVYSVKIWDFGPVYRGFVQLPLSVAPPGEIGLCFVDSCKNSFDNSILKCHEEGPRNTRCDHIESAFKSRSVATPLTLHREVLKSLKIGEEMREKLREIGEQEGPLVQNVSKAVMAVKCQVSAKHPSGYLHFIFVKGKGRESYEKFYCTCFEFPKSETSSVNKQKCLHYYACVWALASDEKFTEEFSTILKYEFPEKERAAEITNTNLVVAPSFSYKSTISSTKFQNLTSKRKLLTKISKKSKTQKRKETIERCRNIMPKVLPIEIKVLDDPNKKNNALSWDFIDWLSFVTESINSTMQFENYGIVNTIVLQIPENFYKCLAQRIPSVYEVLRTENSLVHYVMNILHLKEIFDTPKVKLKISKKFQHVGHNGYVEYDENDETVEERAYQCRFIYFLNVGQSTVDESDNTNNSFYLEWTPAVFSFSNVGQLRLQYKYGRKSI